MGHLPQAQIFGARSECMGHLPPVSDIRELLNKKHYLSVLLLGEPTNYGRNKSLLLGWKE
jgi:hypothetical protein